MANHTHSSSGGGGFRVDLDMTDFTQEISEGIQLAIRRALVRIELECEGYAKMLCHVVTGRLRNSITNYVEGNATYIGTNVEYAQFEEEGTSRRPPHPYLRPAAEGHMDEWRRILEGELENGG